MMKKVAIVTGGSRGIGFGIVKQLAKEGFAVAIVAASPEENHYQRFEELNKIGAEYKYIQCDVSETEDRERCTSEVMLNFGRIDVLVNNAGIAPQVRADLLEMSEDSFDRLIRINTKSVMFFSQLIAKQMIKQEKSGGIRGIIINMSSMSADVSSINRGEYCVSKAAVSMLTKLYADRLAAESVFVYEIRPGIIATDMTSTVKEKYDILFEQGICPIKRWGTPEDIGNAVSILCEGKLLYTTGQVLYLDGGFHIQRL